MCRKIGFQDELFKVNIKDKLFYTSLLFKTVSVVLLYHYLSH